MNLGVWPNTALKELQQREIVPASKAHSMLRQQKQIVEQNTRCIPWFRGLVYTMTIAQSSCQCQNVVLGFLIKFT